MSARVVKQQLAALQQSREAATKLQAAPVVKKKKLRKRNKKQAARIAFEASGKEERQKQSMQKVLDYLRVTTTSKVTTQAAEKLQKVKTDSENGA